jgi:hypothetical protein
LSKIPASDTEWRGGGICEARVLQLDEAEGPAGSSRAECTAGSCSHNSFDTAEIFGIEYTRVSERAAVPKDVPQIREDREAVLGPAFVDARVRKQNNSDYSSKMLEK